MGNISYKPLIEDMTWSFSRITSFEDCPYRWYLTYIRKLEDEEKFYASYGTFMHKIIERYYKGEIKKDDMLAEFLLGFSSSVKGRRPKTQTVQSYIEQGSEYFANFEPFPYNPVGIEKRVNFEIDGIRFTGFIDYLGERDGDYYIIDNKSRILKPRSKRAKPTQNDIELDEMLKQLYLYSAAVEQEYGKTPKSLCFNCFRNGQFIEEPFDNETYEKTKKWAVNKVHEIEETEEFIPFPDFFSCLYICGMSEHCDKKEIK